MGWMALLALVGQSASPFSFDKEKRIAFDSEVDQKKVDYAILCGSNWLVDQAKLAATFAYAGRTQGKSNQSVLELAVLTLAHADRTEADPKLKTLVDAMLAKKPESTYTVSIQAMALQKLDPAKYQKRIAECAQFLVDNQAENGQWCYGAPTDPPKIEDADIATAGSGKAGLRRIVIKRNPNFGKRPPSGDNSNSQYAALGIRACMESGCVIEKEVLQLARKWWIESQCADGGWHYQKGSGFVPHEPGTQLEIKAAEGKKEGGGEAWGSMTVGAVGALCIYDFFLNINYKNDASVRGGVEWIAKHFTVTENARRGNHWYLYYLYGLERAGVLFGAERFGEHKWYARGANQLLGVQKPDGQWDNGGSAKGGTIADTCFAILFLKRATAPLIYSSPANPKAAK